MTASMGVLMYADPESGRSSSNIPLVSNLQAGCWKASPRCEWRQRWGYNNGGVVASPLVEPSIAVGQRARTAWRHLSIGLPTARISRFQTVGSWEP
ncbi:hypothetical protein QR685DRAFT_576234 [Neurospora intermedia]|uniref:Uncharacterized protein n=1 Tax=Neurospora intermedia TaxID=5142 RepID=A0ABR3D0N0_NEUIN